MFYFKKQLELWFFVVQVLLQNFFVVVLDFSIWFAAYGFVGLERVGYAAVFGCRGRWFMNFSVLVVDSYTIKNVSQSSLIDWHGIVWTRKSRYCLLPLLQEVDGT